MISLIQVSDFWPTGPLVIRLDVGEFDLIFEVRLGQMVLGTLVFAQSLEPFGRLPSNLQSYINWDKL